MKRFSSLILATLCIILAVGTASASPLNKKVLVAQKEVCERLSNYGINWKIDESDNSVNFTREGIIYWITFKEFTYKTSDSAILYTLHRKPIKIDELGLTGDVLDRYVTNAKLAANQMNVKYPFKTFFDNNRVQFVFPMFAVSPFDFIKSLEYMIGVLKNADEFYGKCLKDVESSNKPTPKTGNKSKNPFKIVSRVPGNLAPAQENITISNADFRIVDSMGKPLSNYKESIRKGKLKFIQPCISVKASKKGVYTLKMQIIDEKGDLLVPSANDSYTLVINSEFETKDKDIAIDGFGSDDGNVWQLGEYKVLFFDGDDNLLYQTNFHVI